MRVPELLVRLSIQQRLLVGGLPHVSRVANASFRLQRPSSIDEVWLATDLSPRGPAYAWVSTTGARRASMMVEAIARSPTAELARMDGLPHMR